MVWNLNSIQLKRKFLDLIFSLIETNCFLLNCHFISWYSSLVLKTAPSQCVCGMSQSVSLEPKGFSIAPHVAQWKEQEWEIFCLVS